MIQIIKKKLYFVVAWYFRFFAEIKLRRWKPRIIVITGSSGKTTLLHLVEAQLGSIAKYSHHANSSIGIPFDILELHRKSFTVEEWPYLILSAPFKAFSNVPKEKIYVVESDCDRPYEGKFLSSLLNPEITLWTNVSRTHSVNFGNTKFESIDEAIAYEFGYFAENTSSIVITNSNYPFLKEQLKRVKCTIRDVGNNELAKYEIRLGETYYKINQGNYYFKYLLPKEMAMSILMCRELVNYLNLQFDKSFSKLYLPAGRSNFFKGIKNTTLIDSTYNTNFDSMRAMINMFANIKANNKWLVLGDMIEQGEVEKEEHLKLARIILENGFKKVVLMGSRVSEYTYKELVRLDRTILLQHFLGPKEVLDYLRDNIKGGEIILFKGARFLEGVIENLLENKSDAQYLARREKVWDIRRKKWGL